MYIEKDDEDQAAKAAKESMRGLFEAKLTEQDITFTKETVEPQEAEAGRKVFMFLTAKTERLEREAEHFALNLDLKDRRDLTVKDGGGCFGLFKYFQTDDHEDMVAAPFQVKHRPLYVGSDDGTMLRTAHRQLLLFEIIYRIAIPVSDEDREATGKASIGLSYFLLKKIYNDAFFVHDSKEEDGSDIRSKIALVWGKTNKFQPTWKLRDYFGEKIALYFAWLGDFSFSLIFPALFGLAVFFYGLKQRSDLDSPNFSASMGAVFDNDATPFFALAICLWGSLFLEGWKRKEASLSYQWDVRDFEEEERERPSYVGTRERINPITNSKEMYVPFAKQLQKLLTSYSVLIMMILLVVMSAVSVITYRVIAAQWDVNPAFVSVTPSILNAISIQIFGFLYNMLAQKLTEWENHRTQTQFNDHLIIKLFAFQFVNSYTALFYIAFFRKGANLWGNEDWKDECGVDKNCMSMLSMQVLVMIVVSPIPKLLKQNIIPWIKVTLRKRKIAAMSSWFVDEQCLEPSETATTDFTVGEYLDKVISYGYLTIFATAFPLAPLFVMLTNFLDLRWDGSRLLWKMRRPCPQRAEDIGMWHSILEFVNAVAVVSNGFLLAFTSQYGKDVEEDYGRLSNMWILVGFEHIVFVTKFIIAYLIPDIPASIVAAETRKKLLLQQIFDGSVV